MMEDKLAMDFVIRKTHFSYSNGEVYRLLYSVNCSWDHKVSFRIIGKGYCIGITTCFFHRVFWLGFLAFLIFDEGIYSSIDLPFELHFSTQVEAHIETQMQKAMISRSISSRLAAGLAAAYLPPLAPPVEVTKKPPRHKVELPKPKRPLRIGPNRLSLKNEILLATALDEQPINFNTRTSLDLKRIVEDQVRLSMFSEINFLCFVHVFYIDAHNNHKLNVVCESSCIYFIRRKNGTCNKLFHTTTFILTHVFFLYI